MFKQIVIELTEPICSCEEQNLQWEPYIDDNRKWGLRVTCKTCKTLFQVSGEKFRAGFKFDKPYPGKKTVPQPDKPKLTIMDGGRVLPFVRPTDEEQEPKAGA